MTGKSGKVLLFVQQMVELRLLKILQKKIYFVNILYDEPIEVHIVSLL